MTDNQEDRYIEQIRALKAEVEQLTEQRNNVGEKCAKAYVELHQWREVGQNVLPDLYGVNYDRVVALLAKGEQ